MRVLMLGWDFSPRLSGGIGSACQGLAGALARAREATEVLFVLPRLRGDEEPEKVRLLAADGERAPAAPSPVTALAPAPEAPRREEVVAATPGQPVSMAAAEPPKQAAPALPPASEMLRLLAIDSPLRPYLSAREYDEAVQRLLARIRATSPATSPAPAARHEAAFPVVKLSERRAARSVAAQATRSTARASATVEARAVYGRTLNDEVERYARAALEVALPEHF